jgi:hypothetical protein
VEKGSPIFSLCQKALKHFRSHLTWIPGNGKEINVWEDSIMGDPPLGSGQGLDRLKAWMRTQNLKSMWDISIWGNDERKTWIRWEIANRPPELEEEWNILKYCLQGKSPLKERKKDKRGWGALSGIYTTAAGYQHTTTVPNVPPDLAIWKAIWTPKSIPKIDMFVWTMAHRGILTGENLRRRGWEGPYRCPLCSQEEETTDHLLLNCIYSKEVWQLALGLQPNSLILPQEVTILLQNWSSLCPFQKEKKDQISTLWRTLPKFIFWNIWLERNNRLFRETKSSPAQVATKTKAYFGESAPYFYKAKNSRPLEAEEEHWIEHFKLRDQQQQTGNNSLQEAWEIRKEDQDFEEWKRKENKHIFFFDGASKGNPGPAGGGGVLVSPTGHLELRFAWGLGIETNNRAEALALWQGLNQAIIHNVQDLVIIGDSRLIIQALILRKRVKNAKLQHILEKIHLLLGKSMNLSAIPRTLAFECISGCRGQQRSPLK